MDVPTCGCGPVCGIQIRKKKWSYLQKIVDFFLREAASYPSPDSTTHRHWDNLIWYITSLEGRVVANGVWVYTDDNEKDLSWSTPFATADNLKAWVTETARRFREEFRVCISVKFHRSRGHEFHIHFATNFYLGQNYNLGDDEVGELEIAAKHAGRRLEIEGARGGEATTIHFLPPKVSVGAS
jgi:hypothetical protein